MITDIMELNDLPKNISKVLVKICLNLISLGINMCNTVTVCITSSYK